MIYFPSDDYMSNQHQSIMMTYSFMTVESRQSKLTQGNGRMIMTGQNTWNTENRWTVSVCEAHRVREGYIHPSAHHTRANVDTKEENSGPYG